MAYGAFPCAIFKRTSALHVTLWGSPVNIVFAISEVEELVKTGGLADVGKALPLALDTLGGITIVMPYCQYWLNVEPPACKSNKPVY